MSAPTREECFAEAVEALRFAAGAASGGSAAGPLVQGLAMAADAWTKLGAWMKPAEEKPPKSMGFGGKAAP